MFVGVVVPDRIGSGVVVGCSSDLIVEVEVDRLKPLVRGAR